MLLHRHVPIMIFYQMVFTAKEAPRLKHTMCHSFSPRLPVVLLRQRLHWLQTGSAMFSTVCHTAAANHTSQKCNAVSTVQIAKTKQDLPTTCWLVGTSNLTSKFVEGFHFRIYCSSKTFSIFRFSYKTVIISWNYKTKSLDVAPHTPLHIWSHCLWYSFFPDAKGREHPESRYLMNCNMLF